MKSIPAPLKAINPFSKPTILFPFVMFITPLVLLLILLSHARVSFHLAKQNTLTEYRYHIVSYASQFYDMLFESWNILSVTSKNVESMLQKGVSNKDIEQYLVEQTKLYRENNANPRFASLYGYIRNSYIDGNQWTPGENYDPKNRPWYSEILKGKGQNVVVSPYSDAETDHIVMSLGSTLSDGESMILLDSFLTASDTLMPGISVIGDKYYIFDQSGGIIAAGDKNEIGKNYLTAEDNSLSEKKEIFLHASQTDMVGGDFGSERITVGGEVFYFISNRLTNGWIGLALIPQSQLRIAVIKSLLPNACLTLFITLLLWGFISGCFLHLVKERARAVEMEQKKNMFFARVSHEIRTPLNAILGFSTLLKDSSLDKETADEYLGHVMRAGNGLAVIVNDILNLSKLESKQLPIVKESYNVPKLLREIQEGIRYKTEKKNLTLCVSVPSDIPPLMLDPRGVNQVVIGLLDNAAKFTSDGLVTLSASFRRTGITSGMLSIDVKDTGMGIPESILPHIFDPFYQDDSVRDQHLFKGSGLGLAIARRLAEAMGGTIEVKSEIGKGSCFTLELPEVEIADKNSSQDTSTKLPRESQPEPSKETPQDLPMMSSTELPRESQPEPSKETPRNHKPDLLRDLPKATDPSDEKRPVALLLDDIPINLKVLTAILKRANVDCIPTLSGKEALEKLKTKKVDYILTDMWMPEMNGEEFAKAVRANPDLCHIPIYAVTADVEVQANFDTSCFDDVIMKPVTLEKTQRILTNPMVLLHSDSPQGTKGQETKGKKR